MSDKAPHFLRGTLVIGSLTLASRVLGLVRDMLCAATFGTGMVWDAFSFAFRVPNLLRRLFGEGALSAAFVPVFTQYLELRDRKDAWRLAGTVGTTLAAVLVACLLVGEALVLLLPRVAELSALWRLSLALTAVLLPYMVFICLTALAAAILNSLRHFALPALAPVVLNLCWIGALVAAAPVLSGSLRGRAFVLAGGILVAGLLQLLLQVGGLRRKGFRLRPALDLRHPGLRRIAVSMAPITLGLAAFQVNVLLDGVIAISLSAPAGTESFTILGASVRYPMQIGANSVLYYSNRLMQFPLGVFGIALATAVFPALSARAARKDWSGFCEELTDGLGVVLFIGIPAGAGMIALARPMIDLLFGHGAFADDPSATARTAAALTAYCTGIWAYCALHVLVRAFYSLQDTVTPVKVAVAAIALNLAINLALLWPLGEAGLAAATSVSAAVQCCVLYAVLRGRMRPGGQVRLAHTLLKTCLATAVMVASVSAAGKLVAARPGPDDLARRAIGLFVPLGVGTVVFFVAAAALHVREMKTLLAALRRRIRMDAGGRQ